MGEMSGPSPTATAPQPPSLSKIFGLDNKRFVLAKKKKKFRCPTDLPVHCSGLGPRGDASPWSARLPASPPRPPAPPPPRRRRRPPPPPFPLLPPPFPRPRPPERPPPLGARVSERRAACLLGQGLGAVGSVGPRHEPGERRALSRRALSRSGSRGSAARGPGTRGLTPRRSGTAAVFLASRSSPAWPLFLRGPALLLSEPPPPRLSCGPGGRRRRPSSARRVRPSEPPVGAGPLPCSRRGRDRSSNTGPPRSCALGRPREAAAARWEGARQSGRPESAAAS